MANEDLIKKCELQNFNFDNDLMTTCSNVLSTAEEHKEKLGLKDEEVQTFLQMTENLKPEDVSEALKLALKIRENGDIKDTEVQTAASKLIRAIEMG
ncbi:MAG: hypothetical protein LBR15_02895 [Methanobrevibacter sp.]|jgi:NADP-dependent 3-hydroxy acid dehydrogenase YdfG|nr:hypothetical protein [Candidatus Methanovirga australis]